VADWKTVIYWRAGARHSPSGLTDSLSFVTDFRGFTNWGFVMKIEIEVRALPEDMTISEYAKASGLHDNYKSAVKEVIKRARAIDRHSIWGWCCAEVVATIDLGSIRLVGRDILGACSHESELDFVMNSGYYDDMVVTATNEALARLDVKGANTAHRKLLRMVEGVSCEKAG
jgi:hypothetical protein